MEQDPIEEDSRIIKTENMPKTSKKEQCFIEEDHQVIFKKGDILKSVKIRKNRSVFLCKTKFTLDGAIGHMYGTTFEVKNSILVKVEKDILVNETGESHVTSDNRNLEDCDQNQKMSRDDIMALKAQGAGGDDIVEKLVENSATFTEKTTFSQQKYIKKKKRKYLNEFTILKPSVRLVWEMYYKKGPSQICDLRIDSLSQILTQGNINTESTVLLVENCHGLVLGAIMDRLAGRGKIVHLFNGTDPSRQCLESFGFPADYYNNVFSLPMSQVNSIEHSQESTTTEENVADEIKNIIVTEEDSDDHKRKINEQTAKKRMSRKEQWDNAKQLLRIGDMDALIVVCKHNPVQIVKKLLAYVASSRPIVVYCQHQQPLIECYTMLKSAGVALCLKLTETWLRDYQVLPDRTHPMMTMNGSSGYLLTGTYVGSN